MRAPRRCLETFGETVLPVPPGSLPNRLKYTSGFRDHILAAIRLFTCQRAFTSYAANLYGLDVVRISLCLSASGRRIIASPPSLSTGCRENFFAAPSRLFNPEKPSLTGRFLSAEAPCGRQPAALSEVFTFRLSARATRGRIRLHTCRSSSTAAKASNQMVGKPTEEDYGATAAPSSSPVTSIVRRGSRRP